MIGRIRVGPVTTSDVGPDTAEPHPQELGPLRRFAPVPSYLARPGLLRPSAGNGSYEVEADRIAGEVMVVLRRGAPGGAAVRHDGEGQRHDGEGQRHDGGEAGADPSARQSGRPAGIGRPAGPGVAGTVRRQLEAGRYRLKSDGNVRDDTPEYPVLASLPSGTRVKVLDNGGRKSLFKAGWFVTNEHSWSEAPDHSVGWIDDSRLEYSLSDELDDAFAQGPKPTIEQLQKIIESATPAERKQAAGDGAFLGRAKAALDEDTYLGLLPALGVHQQPTKPTLSQGGSGHTPGPEADRVIREHLQQYLVEAIKAGRKVDGEVSVVGDEDFQMAFDRQWVRGAGQTFPGQKAWEVCNAFVDVNLPKRHIWVHRDMGDTGTVIHEGMHKYADATLRDEQIALCKRLGIPYGGTSRLDEGTTEYFTRLVVGQLKMRQRVNYQNEFLVASKLARRFGEKTLARAYYDGQFVALQKAIGTDWPQFAEAIEKEDWAWLSANKFM